MIDVSLARRLKLVGLDVDGVLTDNGIYVGMVGDHPVELKRFHIQDGLGIKLLRDAGLVVVLASARRSEATELRARELKVDEVVQDKRKLRHSRTCCGDAACRGKTARSWATTFPIFRCCGGWGFRSPWRTRLLRLWPRHSS